MYLRNLHNSPVVSVSRVRDLLHLQVLEHEQAYLAALPSAQMYEKSFMHRDTVTQVAVAQDQDFLITGSIDGHLKFWKKTPTGIEFAKHYRAHVGALDGASLWLMLDRYWQLVCQVDREAN